MATSTLNYFTCTLGQAVIWKNESLQQFKSINTVLDLVERQASTYPQSLALGFADSPFKEAHNRSPLVTFENLQNLSITAARTLAGILSDKDESRRLETQSSNKGTVGLLCTSSVGFMITYLGLMRLGYVVLLLAPQLEPSAIEHLCSACGVKLILVDELLIDRTAHIRAEIDIRRIPDYYDAVPGPGLPHNLKTRHFESSDPVHIFHTSGTSSGLPKPIVQTHWAAVGVLPYLTDQAHAATFSTTPLYHGGLADCFRAWTSASMAWFFPEGTKPITSTNIIKAVMSTREVSDVEVKYFTGVPYVLQILGEEAAGVQLLQTMDLVGVGGAALAPAVGDYLTKAGVRLISRMGSAECGFLMSSDRDFSTDLEWQYLRPVANSNLLSFEARGDGLFELVARQAWPLKAKTNRDDGSYATSDLFQPHPTLPNAWRYHSRADAQITLASGKKFDPSPIEASILASSKLLQDVLVFGTGRPYAGALLFPKSTKESDDGLIEGVWAAIETVNGESQSHARLSRQSLAVVKVNAGQDRLEKSSKGTIMRRSAEERYVDIIESVYADKSRLPRSEQVTDNEVLTAMTAKFAQVTGREIDPEEDLFRQGVDSIACIQIRSLIQSSMVPAEAGILSSNVVYEHGTIAALSKHVIKIRQATTCTAKESEEAAPKESDSKIMSGLVKKYSNFQFNVSNLLPKSTETILLTGATGSLGSHVLHRLRENPNVHKVYCLVRAHTSLMAHERVSKALAARGMPGLEALADGPQQTSDKVTCLPCDFSDPEFGLEAEQREEIRVECTTCIHAAWPVNFSLRLESFEEHLSGLHNLLAFAVSARAHFAFISSTAAVNNSSSTTVPEEISSNSSDASPLGYAQSKWVAEKLCAVAHHASSIVYAKDNVKGPTISVLRVGQLCGNALGVWNASEAYPLMLSTYKPTGCLPSLQGESLNWLPVDQAAQAVLEVALDDQTTTPLSSKEVRSQEPQTSTPVYHILNPHMTPSWQEMLQWLLDEDGKTPSFQIVSSVEWVNRLEICLHERQPAHSAQKLLAFWKKSLDANKRVSNEEAGVDKGGLQQNVLASKFEVTRASRISHTLANVQPLNRNQIARMWQWIGREVK